VNESVSDEARKDQWGVRSIDVPVLYTSVFIIAGTHEKKTETGRRET